MTGGRGFSPLRVACWAKPLNLSAIWSLTKRGGAESFSVGDEDGEGPFYHLCRSQPSVPNVQYALSVDQSLVARKTSRNDRFPVVEAASTGASLDVIYVLLRAHPGDEVLSDLLATVNWKNPIHQMPRNFRLWSRPHIT